MSNFANLLPNFGDVATVSETAWFRWTLLAVFAVFFADFRYALTLDSSGFCASTWRPWYHRQHRVDTYFLQQ